MAVFDKPTTHIAGVFAPNGKAESAEGGFRVSGRWQWGSGTQNADWVLCGSLLTENGEPTRGESGAPLNHMMLVPADQVEAAHALLSQQPFSDEELAAAALAADPFGEEEDAQDGSDEASEA